MPLHDAVEGLQLFASAGWLLPCFPAVLPKVRADTQFLRHLVSVEASAREPVGRLCNARDLCTPFPTRGRPSHPAVAAQRNPPGYGSRTEIVSAGASRSQPESGRQVRNSCAGDPVRLAILYRSARTAWLRQSGDAILLLIRD